MQEDTEIEDWDIGIGDSMDGTGRLRDERPAEKVCVGILHAVYPRHQASSCAFCGKSIRECDIMYSRDDSRYFCDPSHERQYQRATGGN